MARAGVDSVALNSHYVSTIFNMGEPKGGIGRGSGCVSRARECVFQCALLAGNDGTGSGRLVGAGRASRSPGDLRDRRVDAEIVT